MTSLAYGIDIPYEVQLEHHAAASANYMTILEPQRSPLQPVYRHLLAPGVYMVSLSYNGSQSATLRHVGGGAINTVTVPTGTAGTPRASAPIKISVQGTAEYLEVQASASIGGSARATISVIPAATFDEMAESAQGVSVLSEISNLQSSKADKSTLDARVPANTSLRRDDTVGTRIFAGDTMIHGDTGWRNITDSIINGWGNSMAPILIIRTGNTVEIGGPLSQRDTATSDAVLALPPGFRPQPIPATGTLVGTVTRKSAGVLVDLAGNVHVNRSTDIGQNGGYFYVTYTTNNSWPTTLPGLPA